MELKGAPAKMNDTKHDFDHGALGPFDASHDLLGDRSVLLLPTPGHTMGHSVVLVQLDEASALVAGDALYTLRHLDATALASFNYFGEQGLATYREVPWSVMSRGMAKEGEQLNTDEQHLRAFWIQWDKLMSQ